MGGTLTVTSEGRDRGSCFTFTIPLHERSVRSSVPRSSLEAGVMDTPYSAVPNGGAAEAAAALPCSALASPASSSSPSSSSASPSEEVHANGSRPPLRVLVAEDDGLCAALMRKILVRLQVDGTLVSDGAAAVAAYQQGARPCEGARITRCRGLTRMPACHPQLRSPLMSSSWTCSACPAPAVSCTACHRVLTLAPLRLRAACL